MNTKLFFILLFLPITLPFLLWRRYALDSYAIQPRHVKQAYQRVADLYGVPVENIVWIPEIALKKFVEVHR